MRRIDRRIVIVFILVFVVGLAYGLMRYLISLKEEPKTRPQMEMVRYVSAEEVTYSDVVSPVEAPGRISSVSELDIVAEASGKILVDQISLKKGAQFKKGDILFTVYPDEAILQLKASKSRFTTILVNLLPDIRIDYPDFEEAFKGFYLSIDINMPLPDLPQTSNPAITTFLASRNVLSEYYTIKRDELSLSRRTIYAPFDGTYTEVYMEAGGYTNAGGRVARAIRTDFLELEIPLERFHSDFVKIGDKVSVADASGGHSWSGSVIRKAQFVDPGTQSQSVFVKVPNSATNPVLVGEYLTATFEGQLVENVMEINRNAVFNTNEVFVIVDGHIQNRTIDIVKVNEKTLLFRGLQPGSTVVTQPLINVMEGTAVAVLGDEPPQQKGTGNGQGKPEGTKGK